MESINRLTEFRFWEVCYLSIMHKWVEGNFGHFEKSSKIAKNREYMKVCF